MERRAAAPDAGCVLSGPPARRREAMRRAGSGSPLTQGESSMPSSTKDGVRRADPNAENPLKNFPTAYRADLGVQLGHREAGREETTVHTLIRIDQPRRQAQTRGELGS